MLSIYRLADRELFDLIQPYRITKDSDMPWVYQFANPQGRPYHEDHGIKTTNPILKALQPWQSVRRMDTAYKLPQPYRIFEGPKQLCRIPFKEGYPLSPGTRFEYGDPTQGEDPKQLFIWAEYGLYGLCKYEAYIPHLDKWVHVFTKYTGKFFGKRLSWYAGVHQDQHSVDAMCYYPEFACSFVKEPS